MTASEDHPVANLTQGFITAILAGLTTVLGMAFIPLVSSERLSKEKVTSAALAFAAGVMLWLAFLEALAVEAPEFFESHYSLKTTIEEETHDQKHQKELQAKLMTAVFFFIGALLTIGIDYVSTRFLMNKAMEGLQQGGDVQHHDAGMQVSKAFSDVLLAHTSQSELGDSTPARDVELVQSFSAEGGGEGIARQRTTLEQQQSLTRVSLVAFLALTLHNLPEGLATFFSGATGSWGIAFAVALHNIPEGAAIAIPVYQSTKSIGRAFGAVFIAGFAQPVGALVGYGALKAVNQPDVPDFMYGAMFALTAGIMIAISILGLLPEALKAASPLFVFSFCFGGFFVMECSLMLLGVMGAH